MERSELTNRHYARVTILTISDTRSFDTDTSGEWLQQAVEKDGHKLIERRLVIDDIYQIRATASNWIADNNIDVILTTGCLLYTSPSPRDGLLSRMPSSA